MKPLYCLCDKEDYWCDIFKRHNQTGLRLKQIPINQAMYVAKEDDIHGTLGSQMTI